jgi:hypothetical protein
MSSSEDTALVVSVHAETATRKLLSQNIHDRALRINLKWMGEHDLADFNLEQLGRLVACEKETEHTGWALIEPRRNVNPGDTVSLRQKAGHLNELRPLEVMYVKLFDTYEHSD